MIEKKKMMDIYLEATSVNGIINQITESKCADIQTTMNNILNRFNMEIKIENYKTKNSTYIVILKIVNGLSLEAERCSGFEKFMINMAFKIALKSISNKSVPSILILDEVLSCVDKYNMDKLNELLEFMKENFDKIFVITHNDVINNYMDYSIKVERVGQYSRVVC